MKPKATAPKKFTRIPATPHKQESDEFWDQHATDNWTDLHSPQNNSLGRTLRILSDSEGEKDGYSPDDYLSDSASVVSTMTTITNMMPKSMKPVSAADRKSKRDWDSRKNELAESFIQELDREINNGEVGCYYNNHGGITLEWNSKLRTTAGRAKLVKGVIELSGKVITCEGKQALCNPTQYLTSNRPTLQHGGTRVLSSCSLGNQQRTPRHPRPSL